MTGYRVQDIPHPNPKVLFHVNPKFDTNPTLQLEHEKEEN